MARRPTDPAQSGLPLIELLAVLAILVTAFWLAAPSMRQLVFSNQLRSETSRLLTAINLTRSEAVIRNTPVSMCPSMIASAGETVCSGNYADGWMVYSNRNRDRVVDSATDEVIEVFSGLAEGYSITNRAGTLDASELITYFPDGTSRRNRTLLLCPPTTGDRDSLSIVMNMVGSPRVARNWGTCPGT